MPTLAELREQFPDYPDDILQFALEENAQRLQGDRSKESSIRGQALDVAPEDDPYGNALARRLDAGMGTPRSAVKDDPFLDFMGIKSARASEGNGDAFMAFMDTPLRIEAPQKDATMGDAFKLGYERFKTSAEVPLNKLGIVSDEELTKDIAADNTLAASQKRPGYLAPIEAAVKQTNEADGFGNTAIEMAKLVGTALVNPKAMAYLFSENAANQIASLGGMAGGAAAGFAAGGGPVGALIGLAGGALIGNSPEYGGKVVEMVGAKAQKLGVDPRKPENILRILNDEEFRSEAERQGVVKWATISAVDTVTGGLVGRGLNAAERGYLSAQKAILSRNGVTAATAAANPIAVAELTAAKQAFLATQTTGKRLGRMGAATGAEMFSEGGGEFLGEGLASGEWRPGDATLEGLLALGQSVGEAVVTGKAFKAPAPADILAAPTSEEAIATFDAATRVDAEASGDLTGIAALHGDILAAERQRLDAGQAQLDAEIDQGNPAAIANPADVTNAAGLARVAKADLDIEAQLSDEQQGLGIPPPAADTTKLPDLGQPVPTKDLGARVREVFENNAEESPAGKVTLAYARRDLGEDQVEAIKQRVRMPMTLDQIQQREIDARTTRPIQVTESSTGVPIVHANTPEIAAQVVEALKAANLRTHTVEAGSIRLTKGADKAQIQAIVDRLNTRYSEQRTTFPDVEETTSGTETAQTVAQQAQQQTTATQQGELNGLQEQGQATAQTLTLGNPNVPMAATVRKHFGDRLAAGAQIGIVENLDQLPTQVDANTGPRMSRHSAQNIRKLAGMLGRKVVFYESTDKSVPEGINYDGKTIYVNVDTQVSELAIAGHEFTHSLEHEQPELYKAALEAVKQVMRSGGLKKAQSYANYSGTRGEEFDAIARELLSDIGGNEWRDGSFWSDVFEQIREAHPPTEARSIISKLRDALVNFINKLIRATPKQGYQHGYSREDLVGIREMLVKAAAQSFRRAERQALGLDAEVSGQGGEVRFAAKRTSDNDHKRTKSGDYVGAPPGMNPSKLGKLRLLLTKLAREGEPGRLWYEESSDAILAAAEGNKELAEKVAGLLAIYSPQMTVSGNTTVGLKALYQWMNGEPIRAKTGTQDKKAEAWMNGTMGEEDALQIKTGNFFKNLMRKIDEDRYGFEKQGATIDMWMARVFGYGSKAIGSEARYYFAEREVKKLATELGWEPQQVQAALWVSIKSRVEEIADDAREYGQSQGWLNRVVTKHKNGENISWPPKPELREQYENHILEMALGLNDAKAAEGISKSKYNFGTALKERVGQVSWEALPGKTSGVLPGIFDAPIEQQTEYLVAMDRALRDENGNDLIAAKLGLPVLRTSMGPSAWQMDVGVGAQTTVAVATDRDGSKITINPSARALLNAYAAIRGYVLHQEAVVWHYPLFDSAKKHANGVQIDIGRDPTIEETRALYNAIHEATGRDDWAPAYVPGVGWRVLNFDENVQGPEFAKQMQAVLESAQVPDHRVRTFKSEGDYISNDFGKNPDGSGYKEWINGQDSQLEGSGTGRPDLQGWVESDLRPRAERVNKKFAEKYGWDARPDATRSGSVRAGPEGTVRASERRQGAVSARGVHYSREQRETLSSYYFGTGTNSAELERVKQATDPRIKQRIYFYVNSGRGIRPESGVGAHAHQANLENLYDLTADQRDLVARYGGDANALESAILDAGFDGTLNQTYGIAVLIGPRSIPVEYAGTGKQEVSPAEQAQRSAYGAARDAIAARGDLPAGQLSGAAWKAKLPEMDLSHLEDGKDYFKGDLVQRPRFSESRNLDFTQDGATLESPISSKEAIDGAQRVFLSAFPADVRTYRRSSGTAKAARAISDRALDAIGASPTATREVDQERMGPFSGFETDASIERGFDGNDQLVISLWGKEQIEEGLMEHPALRMTVDQDGDFSIFGPPSKSKTFKEFRARGWAEYATNPDGEIHTIDGASHWTRLTGADEKQALQLLGDAHARMRAWTGKSHVGLHWVRTTGATGGEAGKRGAMFFSEQRLVDTSSKNFKAWFAGSTVANKDGSPMRVYHDTNADFTEFKDSDLAKALWGGSLGWHFGTAEAANERSESLRGMSDQLRRDEPPHRVLPVYLSIKNPLRLQDMAGLTEAYEDEEGFDTEHAKEWENPDDVAEGLLDRKIINIDEFEDSRGDFGKIKEVLRAKGYDGIVYRNVVEDAGSDSWIAFDPEQIKSAVSNTGEFKGPDIRFSLRRALGGDFSTDDHLVPEIEPYLSNDQLVDLAYINTSPIRLNVGADTGPGNGFGGLHILANAARDTRRALDSVSDEDGENTVRTVFNALASQGARLHKQSGNRFALRLPLAQKTLVLEKRGDHYSVVTMLPTAENKWGDAEWTGRLTFPVPADAPSAAPLSPDAAESALGNLSGIGVYVSAKWNPTPGKKASQIPVIVKAKRRVERFSKPRIIGDSGRALTPEQRAMFKTIGREVDQLTTVERIKKWANQNWAQQLVDQFRPVRDLSDHAYTLMRLSKGSNGAFEAFMKHGKLSIKEGAFDGDTTGGVIEKVFAPLGRESTDFLTWIAGNRAERLAKEGKERLFSDADIKAAKSLATGTAEFDYTLANGMVTRKRELIYNDALAKFNGFNKNVMDMAEQSGLIDGASRHLWEHEFYVPFYRVMEDEGGVRGMNIKKGVVRQKAFEKLKGGEEKLNDLLANTLMNWAHLIDAAAKNRAAKATLDAAVLAGVARPSVPGEKNAVWYANKGQKVEFQVEDPALLIAIQGLEFAGLRGPMMDALSKAKHWLTIGVTASPFFKVRNLIRDSVQAIGTSELGPNPFGNVIEGWKLTDRERQEYVSALAGGGLIRFGTMLENNEAARTRQLIKQQSKDAHMLDSESAVRKFYDKTLEPFVSWYNEMGNRGEEINRMALYEKLRKDGMSHAKASLMARDLMDFSMQGSATTVRFLSQVVPFLNARLQGMYKLGRVATGSKQEQQKLALTLMTVTLAGMALMAYAASDEDRWKKWQEREEWDKASYWFFQLGDMEFRIPRPFEIGSVAQLAERGVEALMDEEKDPWSRYGMAMLGVAENQLSMSIVPQLVKPVLDLYANKDSFTKRPIETLAMQRLDKEHRYTPRTSMPARWASDATGGLLSPVQYDHLIRGYFSWLGATSVGVADMAARALNDEPTRPTLDYFKLASGGMAQEEGSASSRYVSLVYDQAKELEAAYSTLRQLRKEGRTEEAQDYAEENQDKLRDYKRVESIKKQLAKLNEQIRITERSGLDADVKRDRIREFKRRESEIAKGLSQG